MFDDWSFNTTDIGDAKLILLPMAVVVLCLAAHVGIGYARHGARAPGPSVRALYLGTAAFALASGSWAASLLRLSEATPFPLGYGAGRLLLAWAAAWSTMALALAWPVSRRGPASVLTGGVLIGVGAVLAQALLVDSAALRPGAAWNSLLLGLALAIPPLGGGAGLWLAMLGPGRDGSHRHQWRWVAAGLLAAMALCGQEMVMEAGSVGDQRSSANTDEVPGTVACLLAGAAVPIVLLVLAVDLRLRRPTRVRRRPESLPTMAR